MPGIYQQYTNRQRMPLDWVYNAMWVLGVVRTNITANEMKVFCSNPNLKYFQILRCRVRVSPRNLSFLENSIKDAIFLPKSSHFRENFKKTTEYFQVAILEPPFGD